MNDLILLIGDRVNGYPSGNYETCKEGFSMYSWYRKEPYLLSIDFRSENKGTRLTESYMKQGRIENTTYF